MFLRQASDLLLLVCSRQELLEAVHLRDECRSKMKQLLLAERDGILRREQGHFNCNYKCYIINLGEEQNINQIYSVVCSKNCFMASCCVSAMHFWCTDEKSPALITS